MGRILKSCHQFINLFLPGCVLDEHGHPHVLLHIRPLAPPLRLCRLGIHGAVGHAHVALNKAHHLLHLEELLGLLAEAHVGPDVLVRGHVAGLRAQVLNDAAYNEQRLGPSFHVEAGQVEQGALAVLSGGPLPVGAGPYRALMMNLFGDQALEKMNRCC